MKTVKLSVLIINFNSWGYFDACVKSILASKYHDLEFVVIDNASIDGSQENIKKHYPNINAVYNEKNVGHVKAINQGLELCKGELILLLDSDTEIKKEAVRDMIFFMEKQPDVWLMAPRTLNDDGSIQETARNFPSVANAIVGRQSYISERFPNNPFLHKYLARNNLNSNDPFKVEFVAASCMLFRKDLVNSIGKWDEKYMGYWVDADWCKRIQIAGGLIYCVPKAVIVHHEQNKRNRRKAPSRIVNFHQGAYRFYSLYYTRGVWDPRRWTAFVLLTLRAISLLLKNMFKKKDSYVDPLSQKN